MTVLTFEAWPKTPRLFRDMIVTEKIDGTNAAIVIGNADPDGGYSDPEGHSLACVETIEDGEYNAYVVGAQSRTRMITPGKATDNYGFAAWVQANAEALVKHLGPGRHFGEWWGKGIQRGYGLDERRFSLFNVGRYGTIAARTDLVSTVPVLYQGAFDTPVVVAVRNRLAEEGSVAAPGFMKPEGVVVYHAAARQTFKALIENDDQPKGG